MRLTDNLSRALYDRCAADGATLPVTADELGRAVVDAMLESADGDDETVKEAVAQTLERCGLPYSLTLAIEAIATVKRELRKS